MYLSMSQYSFVGIAGQEVRLCLGSSVSGYNQDAAHQDPHVSGSGCDFLLLPSLSSE